MKPIRIPRMISKLYGFVFTMLFIFVVAEAHSQLFDIEFQQCYGGSDIEAAEDLLMLADSTYLVLATTQSKDGDISFLYGESDFWIVHVDQQGMLLWEQTLGGSDYDIPKSISMTSKGDILVFGETQSIDGNISGNHGGFDFWIVRTDIEGNIIWEKCIGSSVNDLAWAMTVDSLDNIYTIGSSHGTDGDITSNNGLIDIWIAKLDSNGNLLQQKSFGGEGFDYGSCISLTDDGGCIFGGIVMSNYGDVDCDGPTYNQADIWVVKIDSLFNIQWKNCYGGSYYDAIIDIQILEDGGYLLSGNTNSDDGDVSGFHGVPGGDYHDIWVIKIDSLGNIEWQRCLGGTKQDLSKGSTILNDGSYIVSGMTSSHDGDVVGNHSINIAFDIWLVGIDGDGLFLWQQCFGSTKSEGNASIHLVSDLELFVAGYASYEDGDVECELFHPQVYSDLWLFHVTDTVSVHTPEHRLDPSSIIIYPNPVENVLYYYIKDELADKVLFIYNVYGQKMREYNFDDQHQIEIDVSQFSNGVYVAVLYSNHAIIDKRKFVVE